MEHRTEVRLTVRIIGTIGAVYLLVAMVQWLIHHWPLGKGWIGWLPLIVMVLLFCGCCTVVVLRDLPLLKRPDRVTGSGEHVRRPSGRPDLIAVELLGLFFVVLSLAELAEILVFRAVAIQGLGKYNGLPWAMWLERPWSHGPNMASALVKGLAGFCLLLRPRGVRTAIRRLRRLGRHY